MQDTTGMPLAERIMAIAGGIIRQVNLPDLDDETLRRFCALAVEELRVLTRDPEQERPLQTIDELSSALIADFDQRRAAAAANGGVVGVRSGLDHLDEIVNGLQSGQLYVMSAMPGSGKTTLALQMAATVAQAGHWVLYISLENDATDLARKTVCRLGGISYSAALKGRLRPEQWSQAVGALRELGGRLVLSTPRATMPDLASLLESMPQPPALVIIDYLQAWVKRSGGGEAGDVRERLDRFTPLLRAIGERYGCAVLAISSQNRANYDRGGMVALKESGDIEYGCDVLLTLVRKDDEPLSDPRTTILQLRVDKNRQGMTGKPMRLVLRGDLCMVEEDDL